MLRIALLSAVVLMVPASAIAGGCTSDSCEVGAEHGIGLVEFDRLIAAWATEEVGAPTLALETLLFHGDRSRALLATVGPAQLDDAHRAFLERELDRTQVTVDMRLVDATGAVRGTAGGEDIPLVEGRRLAFEGTGELGFLVTGGKVKRVGLGHLWSRW